MIREKVVHVQTKKLNAALNLVKKDILNNLTNEEGDFDFELT